MIKYKLLAILIAGLLLSGCNKRQDDKPVAKVDDEVLYLSEVRATIPDNSNADDSLLIGDNYVHQWIKRQLIISKAELNLTEQDKDVNRMVEDYRSSLIIHKYQQQLIEQKLDTVVKPFEIDNYYRKYPSSFTLNQNIVKALYIKIPKPVPGLKKIRKLYKSNKDNDWEELEDYCFQNATKFDNFGDQWVNAWELLNQIPVQFNNEEQYLRSRKHIEAEDSTHRYLVKIQKFELKNNIAPLPFVRDDIRKIIINKRKIEFIKNLEESIYRDAELKKKFKIY